jgi:hypothetical protein
MAENSKEEENVFNEKFTKNIKIDFRSPKDFFRTFFAC